MIVVASSSAAATRAPSAASDTGVGEESLEAVIVSVADTVVSEVSGAGDAAARAIRVRSEGISAERMLTVG